MCYITVYLTLLYEHRDLDDQHVCFEGAAKYVDQLLAGPNKGEYKREVTAADRRFQGRTGL